MTTGAQPAVTTVRCGACGAYSWGTGPTCPACGALLDPDGLCSTCGGTGTIGDKDNDVGLQACPDCTEKRAITKQRVERTCDRCGRAWSDHDDGSCPREATDEANDVAPGFRAG